MTSTTQDYGAEFASWTACLQRLATALSGYHELDATVLRNGSAPCLAARNRASGLSETVTVSELRNRLTFLWSWDEPIGDADDPDSAARVIAYVLAVRGTEPAAHQPAPGEKL